MKELEKLNDLLSEAGTYFLATIDSETNGAKVRPIGLNFIVDNKLYFGVGTFKEVYKQMIENPKVEICSYANNKVVRYCGTAVFTEDVSISKIALEKVPMLNNMYNDETGFKLGMFYLRDAKAEIVSNFTEKEILELN